MLRWPCGVCALRCSSGRIAQKLLRVLTALPQVRTPSVATWMLFRHRSYGQMDNNMAKRPKTSRITCNMRTYICERRALLTQTWHSRYHRSPWRAAAQGLRSSGLRSGLSPGPSRSGLSPGTSWTSAPPSPALPTTPSRHSAPPSSRPGHRGPVACRGAGACPVSAHTR